MSAVTLFDQSRNRRTHGNAFCFAYTIKNITRLCDFHIQHTLNPYPIDMEQRAILVKTVRIFAMVMFFAILEKVNVFACIHHACKFRRSFQE